MLTDEAIKMFIETAPLYVWKEFEMPAPKREGLDIKQIESFCEQCQKEKTFNDLSLFPSKNVSKAPPPIHPLGGPPAPDTSLKSGETTMSFVCVTCGEKRTFFVEHTVQGKIVKMQKYGQLPRMELKRNRLLQKFVAGDRELYDKAVNCAADGYGIGSYAYFRVVVENNIASLIELLDEEARTTKLSSKIVKSLASLKKNTPMKRKIEVANHALPEYLKPDGLNLLGRLYAVLSEGVHGLSEVECLEKAKDIEKCLEFLVTELSDRKKNREQYRIGAAKL